MITLVKSIQNTLWIVEIAFENQAVVASLRLLPFEIFTKLN